MTCFLELSTGKIAKMQKVYMGVSEKFGLALFLTWNIISTFFEERKNCHKFDENYKGIASKIQRKYCYFSILLFSLDFAPGK